MIGRMLPEVCHGTVSAGVTHGQLSAAAAG